LASVPTRCRSTGIGSSIVGSRCNTSPTGRLSRIAVCAATIERCRPKVIGSTVPGNSTRLRVVIRISASSGIAGTPSTGTVPEAGAVCAGGVAASAIRTFCS